MKPIRESLIPFKSLAFLYRAHCFEQQHFSYWGERGWRVRGLWPVYALPLPSLNLSLIDQKRVDQILEQHIQCLFQISGVSCLYLCTVYYACGWLYRLLYAHPHFEHKVLNLHFCSIGEGGHWLPRRWAGDLTLSEWWIKENKGWRMKVSAKRPFRPGWIYCYCNHHQYPTIAHSTFVIGSGHYLTLLSLSRMRV